MKLRHLWKALKSQGPPKRFITNFFITGNAWGMFSKRAHWTYAGKEKVAMNTLATAERGAVRMKEKYGHHYSPYVCPYCGKYHLGKNRNDR